MPADPSIVATGAGSQFCVLGDLVTFKNIRSSAGRLLSTMTAARIADFFMEVGALTAEKQADHPTIAATALRYGLEILGPA
jgi:enoyl-CoA hydratase/carnithine racemase